MKAVDFSELWKHDLALSEISVIYQSPAWNVLGQSARLLNGFLLIDKGSCLYEWEEESAKLTPSSLIYLPRGCRKTVTVLERPFSYYRISFDMTDVADGEDTVFCRTPWVVTTDAGRPFYELAESLLRSTLSRRELFGSSARLWEFFGVMQKKLEKPSDSRVAPALEYIETHYTEEIPIPLLASLCYVSEPHLFRLFKKAAGCSPVTYRNRLRIERAKALLSGGECSVGEAAEMTGFSEVYYFDRVFKSVTGVSPGAWAAK